MKAIKKSQRILPAKEETSHIVDQFKNDKQQLYIHKPRFFSFLQAYVIKKILTKLTN